MHQRPEGLGADLERPSVARCYDYCLGGAHNFAVDRALVRKLLHAEPRARHLARHNRTFLHRAVHYCLDQGVRQFLDLGSGIPTLGNVHEVALEAEPRARVIYVDNDPVAVAHGRTILEGDDRADAVHADLVDVQAVLHAEPVTRLLRFSEPIALILASVLEFVPDELEPHKVLREYYDRIAPGSLLCLSHLAADVVPESAARITATRFDGLPGMVARGRAELTGLLAGFEPVDPGLVPVPAWPSESTEDDLERPEESLMHGVVARKRSGRGNAGDPR